MRIARHIASRHIALVLTPELLDDLLVSLAESGGLGRGRLGLAFDPRDRLLALVRKILARNSIARPVSLDDQLTEAGLSSIGMVNLMLTIEAEFDIMIPASEITPTNFRSISAI